jgi:hypothetical protein
MAYKNDSELVIMNRYGAAADDAKAEMFETYDRIRDLMASGPTLGGSGLGKFSSALVQVAKLFGGSPFIPTLGSEAVNIPGTSYFSPISGGTGQVPAGQAAFGLAPFSMSAGFPSGGAAGLTPVSWLSSLGSGLKNIPVGIGHLFPAGNTYIGGLGDGLASGTVTGGAASAALAAGGSIAAGTGAGLGFGRNWVMPAAGIVSGIGGLLTTLGPFFGPFGLAAAASGTVLNGVSGAILSSYQTINQRILNNADTVLSAKVKNLESVVKMLEAQQDVVKKLMKDSIDGDKKLLDNI